MRLNIKSVLMATVFVAFGSSSHADSGSDWRLTSGNATLTFSQDGRSAFSAASAYLFTPAPIPVVPGLDDSGRANTAVLNQMTGRLDLPLTASASVGDALNSVRAEGSVVELKRAIVEEDDEGNLSFPKWFVFLTNWEIDLSSSTVYANLQTVSHSNPLVNLGRTAIFKLRWGSPHGSDGLIVSQGQGLAQANGQIDGVLSLDDRAADLILEGIGLSSFNSPDNPVARLFHEPYPSWGSVSYTANFESAPAVPELNTFLLMGHGILMLMAIRRFNARA